jgi:hypothetical protein
VTRNAIPISLVSPAMQDRPKPLIILGAVVATWLGAIVYFMIEGAN